MKCIYRYLFQNRRQAIAVGFFEIKILIY